MLEYDASKRLGAMQPLTAKCHREFQKRYPHISLTRRITDPDYQVQTGDKVFKILGEVCVLSDSRFIHIPIPEHLPHTLEDLRELKAGQTGCTSIGDMLL